MKHPERSEWMAFLYGEVSGEERRNLDAHLAVCPDCVRQLGRWRATQGLLDAAGVPERRAPMRATWPSALRWAAAAALVLGAGFVVGRQGTVSERELNRQLGELRGQLRADVAAQREADLKVVAEATLQANRAENRAFLEQFLHDFRAVRTADREDLVTALRTIEQRQARETAELREGLANLASSTGTGFEQAGNQMRVLTSYLPSGVASPNPVLEETNP